MAEARPDTCAYCSSDAWCEVRANGKPQCLACKIEAFFTRVLYPPLGYELMPWQRRVLRDLYGTVSAETGVRRYQSAYISVAKKNGKSFLVGGLPIYHLLMETERNPEAYGAAAAKDQAGIVFKAAASLVMANSDLQTRLKVLPSTKRIVRRDGGGFYAVLSADGDVQDGIEPSLLIRDEIHRWKTAKAETLYDVTTKGQISRRQPLDVAVTTAGAEYESRLWAREYFYSKQVESGALESRSHYVAIYEADSKRVESEPEYWKSREARVAANPSHEDLGGFLRDSAIVKELEKAIADPSERSKFFRYNLNVPLKTDEDPIVDMAKWAACDGGVDLRTWPEYDVNFLIRKWDLLDRHCYAGVDASWSTDLTAVTFVFPPFGNVEHWTLLPFFFMPEAKVVELERICQVPYSTWIDRGFIEATQGNMIDIQAVLKRIRWGAEMFDVVEIPYDKLNFRVAAGMLVDEGYTPYEVKQSYLELSEATKFFLASIEDYKIRHGNNPVLNFNASCFALAYDQKDNVMPAKPQRGKSAKRIDGMQAAVTGLSRARNGDSHLITFTGVRSVG